MESAQAPADAPLNAEEIDSETYYEAAIGPNHTEYYLDHFQRFEAEGRARASWHWPAFFLTFYWLLYRKMYLRAFIYFFLPYVLTGVAAFVFTRAGASGTLLVGVGYLLYLGGIFLIPAMYANAWYYKHCNELIREARRGKRSPRKQMAVLAERGGTGGAIIIILVLFAAVGIIGILAAIAIPQYTAYTNKAKLLEASSYAKGATVAVENYYYSRKRVPKSLEEAGFMQVLPSAVAAASVDASNGVVSVVLASPPAMKAPLAGKTLVYVPSLSDTGRVIWACESSDIPQAALPPGCRRVTAQ